MVLLVIWGYVAAARPFLAANTECFAGSDDHFVVFLVLLPRLRPNHLDLVSNKVHMIRP
jgi:hypothetical protein